MREKSKNPSKPSQDRRGKGRPADGTAVGREALIAATQELLRLQPPDRLTLAEIAKHAGVTPALVRYYFGTKEALFTATAMTQLDALQEKGQQALSKDSPLSERLTERLASMIDQVHSNPRFHQLIMDSVYTGSTRESETLTGQAASRGLMLTLALLHSHDGEQLRKIDPRFLHVAMIGLTEFFGSADAFLKQLFGPDADPDELRESYVEFLVDLLLNGLLSKRPKP